jgi:type IV secretion system protein VirB6
MSSTVFQDILQHVDGAVSHYVTDGAAAAAGATQSVAYTLLIIWVVMWGWAVMRGIVKEVVLEGVIRIIKMVIIYNLAINSALYASYVSNFLYEWPTTLAGLLQGGTAQNSAQLLDQMLDKGNLLGAQAWEKATWVNLGSYFLAILIFGLTWVITAIAAFIIMSSKMTLAILLAIGPIFILMMLFEATRQWFDKWLGVVVTAGLTIVFATMGASLIFEMMNSTLDAVQAAAAANDGIASMKAISPLGIMAIMGMFGMLQLPHIAAGVGGGVSTGSAAALGWAFDKLKGSLPERPKRVGKQDKQGGGAGGFSKAAGGSVQGAPMAAYRKITRSRNA